MIHGEAELKRKAGDRRDRVEGRIESLIQGRVRSRGWDFSREFPQCQEMGNRIRYRVNENPYLSIGEVPTQDQKAI